MSDYMGAMIEFAVISTGAERSEAKWRDLACDRQDPSTSLRSARDDKT
jgi:hypothetical protein